MNSFSVKQSKEMTTTINGVLYRFVKIDGKWDIEFVKS